MKELVKAALLIGCGGLIGSSLTYHKIKAAVMEICAKKIAEDAMPKNEKD